ncbi:GNAT family N-acetyltransferase [Pseudochrobactrum sp. MP213Fo]|uniref:GNAT family N-acetyltransferase n=1 Tax=Pseudochrobactrum sp. MP213Fo TaxID=3022250 RepID=UPI003BA3DECF
MLTISHADSAHLPAILDIYNDAIVNSTAVWINEPVDLHNREQWFAARRQDGFPVLVAMQDMQVLGYASYGAFRAFEGYKHTAELSIYIAAQARGKGAGDALMSALLQEAANHHIHVLLGAVEAQNTASLRLHQKHGFTQTGILPQVGRKFDRWLDLIFMQRII